MPTDPDSQRILKMYASEHPDPRIRAGARELLGNEHRLDIQKALSGSADEPTSLRARLEADFDVWKSYLDHPDFTVRLVAREHVEENAAAIAKLGRADVVKSAPAVGIVRKVATAQTNKLAVPTSPKASYDTAELSKVITAAVTKAIGDLPDRIKRLGEGSAAMPPRRRL
jgi:hypothetical protein